MIIDDCYATIGSANIGWRSSTTDSELHLSVVDDDVVPSVMDGVPVTVCRFAKGLRISLWTEHLGLINADLIQDPIAGIAEWPGLQQLHPGRAKSSSPHRRSPRPDAAMALATVHS